jgi:putative DNA primase/helicase
LAALRSGGPYPLLAISGAKLLKALSREQRELMIAANNSYLLAFDNLSGLPHWLSDAL